MEIETGYFFIADITGYTRFLAGSELDHAKEILDALFDSILKNIEPPLVVSNTQGDAIICYAPDRDFIQPQTLLDTMESMYFDFRRRLNLMDINTNCECNACVNMAALDLKIFLHHGDYLVQEIGDRTDLQGADVIMAHRLMKNTVREATGLTGYGLLTEPALEAMGIEWVAEGMLEHLEHYEHLGEVRVFIYDLRKAWDIERERQRTFVKREDAIAHSETIVAIPFWIAWEYILDSDTKIKYWDLETMSRTDDGGRQKIGSSFHCIHRLGDAFYTYVDMNPPNYVTAEYTSLGQTFLLTIQLTPVEEGTQIEFLYGKPFEEFTEETVEFFQIGAKKTIDALTSVIQEDIENGKANLDQIAASKSQRAAYSRPEVAKGRFGNLN